VYKETNKKWYFPLFLTNRLRKFQQWKAEYIQYTCLYLLKIFSMQKLVLLLLLTGIFVTGIKAQITEDNTDDFGGLEAGINVGAYFASGNMANFYNGASNEDGRNSADRIINNTYYLNDINAVLEQNGYRYLLEDGFYETEYPADMKYTPAIYAGLTGRYWLNRKIAISVSMNYSKLYTRDNFVIYNTNPDIPPSNKENQYIIGTIAGVEERVNIDVGLVNSFPIHEKANFLVEYGLNINNAAALENKIEIYGFILDIKYKGPYDYIPNSNTPQYNYSQKGMGYGGYLSPGIQLNFTNDISVDIISQFYYNYINITYDSSTERLHYSNWGLQFAPYIRFNFTRLFF